VASSLESDPEDVERRRGDEPFPGTGQLELQAHRELEVDVPEESRVAVAHSGPSGIGVARQPVPSAGRISRTNAGLTA
jgi:hypothetical protein